MFEILLYFFLYRYFLFHTLLVCSLDTFCNNNHFIKSSIEMLNALAILSIVWTLGLLTVPLSTFISVVYFISAFLAKSSWVKPSLAHIFLIFSLIVFPLVI